MLILSWVFAPRGCGQCCRRFGGTFCLLGRSKEKNIYEYNTLAHPTYLDLEDGGIMYLRNVGNSPHLHGDNALEETEYQQ
jgi:hypothetical protein